MTCGLSKGERHVIRRAVRGAERCSLLTIEKMHPQSRRMVLAEMRKRGWRYMPLWQSYDRYSKDGQKP